MEGVESASAKDQGVGGIAEISVTGESEDAAIERGVPVKGVEAREGQCPRSDLDEVNISVRRGEQNPGVAGVCVAGPDGEGAGGPIAGGINDKPTAGQGAERFAEAVETQFGIGTQTEGGRCRDYV